MATEKIKKTKSLYTESPIKGADIKELNEGIIRDLTGIQGEESPETDTEVIDGHESKEYFREGIVPAGFSKTYGDEVTGATDGQIGQIIATMGKIFDPKDGFRYFLKALDAYRFTIVVPIKFSNMDDLTYAYSRVDARSVTLVPGNTQTQVEKLGRRVAQHLKYTKDVR